MGIEFDQKESRIEREKAPACLLMKPRLPLLDPMALVREDEDAKDELRFLLVGMSNKGHLLTVCYTLRAEAIRLISARLATKNERRQYES